MVVVVLTARFTPARGRLARSALVRRVAASSGSGHQRSIELWFRWLTRGAVSFDARRAIPTIDERGDRVPPLLGGTVQSVR